MSVDMSKPDEAEPAEVDTKTLRRAVGASMIGNATEW